MLTIVSGTNRIDSKSRVIADLVAAHYAEHNVDTQILDLAELPRDIFVPESYGEKPASFEKFQDMILKTDGVIFVVAEYNGSFPGVLKYFIDLLKFPESLLNMPTAFIGVAAGQFGAIRAIEQLEMVCQYRGAHIFGPRVMFPKVYATLSEDGKTITDDFIADIFPKTLDDFHAFAQALRAVA